MHAGGRLFGNAAPVLDDLRPDTGLLLRDTAQERFHDGDFVAVALGLVGPLGTFLEFVTFVDEQVTSPPSSTTSCGPLSPGNKIALSVSSQYSSSVSPFQANTGVPVAAMADGRVILGGEDVAARPTHIRAEGDERLDEHGGLDRHVQRARDAHALERLCFAYFLRTDISRAFRARRRRFPCGPNRRARCHERCSLCPTACWRRRWRDSARFAALTSASTAGERQ
jgi:hypothetical protein